MVWNAIGVEIMTGWTLHREKDFPLHSTVKRFNWFDNHHNELDVHFLSMLVVCFSPSLRIHSFLLSLSRSLHSSSSQNRCMKRWAMILKGEEKVQKCVRQFLCSVKYQFSFLSAIIPFDTHNWSSSKKRASKLSFILTYDWIMCRTLCAARYNSVACRRLRWSFSHTELTSRQCTDDSDAQVKVNWMMLFVIALCFSTFFGFLVCLFVFNFHVHSSNISISCIKIVTVILCEFLLEPTWERNEWCVIIRMSCCLLLTQILDDATVLSNLLD